MEEQEGFGVDESPEEEPFDMLHPFREEMKRAEERQELLNTTRQAMIEEEGYYHAQDGSSSEEDYERVQGPAA